MPPNRPESALARDVGLDAHTATETLEDSSAAQRIRAADVLAAVADLVSAGLNDTVESGPTFTGLARRLEELEARLKHSSEPDDSVPGKRTGGQVEPRIEAPTAVETGASDPFAPARGKPDARNDASNEASVAALRADCPPGKEPRIEIDTAIRNLTIRMAALHRAALRCGAFEPGGGKTLGMPAPAVVPTAGAPPQPSIETSAEASGGSSAATFDSSNDTNAVLTTLVRRLEAKVDALIGKAGAEATSAADLHQTDLHQTDLLARRIESSELQLAKRLDASFAAAAVETRVIEDMLRALAARSEAQGNLGGAVATLDQSVGTLRERLDRIEAQIASLMPAPRGIELGQDQGIPGHAAALARPERETADRQVGATLDAIRDALSGIADRLRLVETRLSAAHPELSSASAWGRSPSPVLPWSEAKTKLGGSDKRNGHVEGFGPMFGHHGDKARHAGLDANAETDILIEPGSGFAPVLDPRAPGATRDLGLDTDEGVGGGTDFIEAARRAARAAHGPLESRAAERADAPPETRETLGAKARRLARIVRCSMFPG